MDLDEFELSLLKKQRLLEQIRGIKAKNDQQRRETDAKLTQLQSIRTEISDVAIKIKKEKITNQISLEELEVNLAK